MTAVTTYDNDNL